MEISPIRKRPIYDLCKSLWFALSHYQVYKLGIKSFSLANTNNVTLFNCFDSYIKLKNVISTKRCLSPNKGRKSQPKNEHFPIRHEMKYQQVFTNGILFHKNNTKWINNYTFLIHHSLKTTYDANTSPYVRCTFFMLVCWLNWLNSRNLGLEFLHHQKTLL